MGNLPSTGLRVCRRRGFSTLILYDFRIPHSSGISLKIQLCEVFLQVSFVAITSSLSNNFGIIDMCLGSIAGHKKGPFSVGILLGVSGFFESIRDHHSISASIDNFGT